VHGDAWCPEDEQPHSDEHHAGSLPRRPQDPRGVPDSINARLTNLKYPPTLSLCIQQCAESCGETVGLRVTSFLKTHRPATEDVKSQ